MLYNCLVCLASKISGGNARNQAGHPRRKPKIFHVIPNTPVTTIEKIKEQRHRYGQDRFSRLPEYYPGKNVRMNGHFTLYATCKGVMTIQKSRVDSKNKWIHIEPDIQKVHRGNMLRRELDQYGCASSMVETNENYKNEFDSLIEPHWQDSFLESQILSKQFPDPNLFSRGIIKEIEPLKYQEKFF